MPKYHVNPKNGNVGVCRAEINCPVGGDDIHGSTVHEAAQAFERYMEEEGVSQFGTITSSTPPKIEKTPDPSKILEEEFKKLKREYDIAKATWDDDMAIHHHTRESIQAKRDKKDAVAARLAGVPEDRINAWVKHTQEKEDRALGR